MTGWTVCVWDKLSQITSMFLLVLVNLLNTTRCGKLLYSEMNTYSNYLNNVIMSSTWGQSAWVFKGTTEKKDFNFNPPASFPSSSSPHPTSITQIPSGTVGSWGGTIGEENGKMVENPSETKRSAFPSGITCKNSKQNLEWLVGVTDGAWNFSL